MKAPLALGMTVATVVSLAAGKRLVEGNPASQVRVVIFEDLECSDCAAFRRMLDDKLLPKYGAKVAFEHRDFPLAKHAWARKAAIAARSLEEAGPDVAIKFRRDVLANIRPARAAGFERWLADWAKANGVDAAKLAGSLADPKLAELVEKDFQDGVARGVSKTPTVFVNGVPFIETFTFEEISKAIDEALKE